jgi:hypothetical protein
MAKFSQPMPEAQRPAASASGGSAVPLMKQGGSKMEDSKGNNPIGADAVKILVMGGQTIDKLPVCPVEPVPTPDGGKGNVASEDVDVSAANVIGPTPDGQEKNKPGRQGTVKGQTGGRANGWVTSTPNPLLQSRPTGRKGA